MRAVKLCTNKILDAGYTIRYDTRCYFNMRSKADIVSLIYCTVDVYSGRKTVVLLLVVNSHWL